MKNVVWIVSLVWVIGSSCNSSKSSNEDTSISLEDTSQSNDSSSNTPPPEPVPVAAICDSIVPADVSKPSVVIGDGSAQTCTETALHNAAKQGGVIVFNCGDEPVTIPVASTITFTQETVVDGGGKVTLDGQQKARIFYLDSGYDQTEPRLTVQHLKFVNGKSDAGGEDTAQGGAAIYRDGGSLTVIDCEFETNTAPSPGQDIAGGAIYAFGGGDTIISDSMFIQNEASNGGAVGSLNGDLTIVNSVFNANHASGTDGNPGNGGCGGAIYMDGRDEKASLCGVQIVNNRAGAIGGGLFRVSNDDSGSFVMEKTTVDKNEVTATEKGNAGGLYLQGLALTVSNSTISRNKAFYNGGIWMHTCNVNVTNTTIAENEAFGSNGGGIWLSYTTGTLLNTTIANNASTAKDQIAGAIFGEGLTLKNAIISGNTAMWTKGCNKQHTDDGSNVQWPDGALCTNSITVADPILGTLGDNGGPTETMLPGADASIINIGTDCPLLDQHGTKRNTPCSIGAVELLQN